MEKSKVVGIVNGGNEYVLGGILMPNLFKSMLGIDRVVGMLRSFTFFPPSGRGSEIAILSLLNWYRNRLSLVTKRRKISQCTYTISNRSSTTVCVCEIRTTAETVSQVQTAEKTLRCFFYCAGFQDMGRGLQICPAIYFLPSGKHCKKQCKLYYVLLAWSKSGGTAVGCVAVIYST